MKPTSNEQSQGFDAETFDQAANERACDFIVHAIAIHPRTEDSAMIIAEEALYGTVDPHDEAITIKHLANLEPDGCRLAEKINYIHALMGVPREVSVTEAATYTLSFAVDAMELIRKRAVAAANTHGIAIAKDLRKSIYTVYTERGLVSDLTIDTARARLLHTTIQSQPELFGLIYEDIAAAASDVRMRGHGQRNKHRGQVALAHV